MILLTMKKKVKHLHLLFSLLPAPSESCFNGEGG